MSDGCTCFAFSEGECACGNYVDYRAERLTVQRDEARRIAVALEQQLARVEALAEKWRYKGEFGWGAWQEGHGPDPEGYVLDCVASDIRAALEADQ